MTVLFPDATYNSNMYTLRDREKSVHKETCDDIVYLVTQGRVQVLNGGVQLLVPMGVKAT